MQASATMASLLTLPLELLVAVSSYLPTSDLASLRLACKQTEKSLYEWFSQEFFTKKQFMLTHASLQTFIDISKHVSLSKKLTHVIIATNAFDVAPRRFRDEDAAVRYTEEFEGQKVLLSSGMDREMLSEAFANLVNLHTVGIRDFNAQRPRDGPDARWSSWGATTIYRQTGIPLSFSRREVFLSEAESDFVSRVFTSVLYALGKVNRQPKEVEVLLRTESLPDAAFSLPTFFRPTVSPVLDALTTLLLNIDLNPRRYHTHGNGVISDAYSGRSLRQFLKCTPNLTHLRLNFTKQFIEANTNFLQWLAEPVSDPPARPITFMNPAPVRIPLLKQLDLGQLTVRPKDLLPVIEKYADTLEDINLWRMDLHSHMAPPHGHKPNYWADLFSAMNAIEKLKLKHLKLGMLQQDHNHVNFTVEGSDQAPPLKVVEYSGKDMDKFYTSLKERAVVSWPLVIDRSSEDSDEDDDMIDDDEEEEEDDEENEEDDDE